MLGSEVGKLMEGCEWVGVPFAGGMCELPHITARTIVANDLHNHVINLARVVADVRLGPKLYRRLRRLAFHPSTLKYAQDRCLQLDYSRLLKEDEILDWAENYFVSVWMGRSAKAGTDGEFKGGLPIRWNAAGGDSCVRYQSAVHSLAEWRKVFRRVNFDCRDAFEFLQKCKDAKGHGIYCDPPFPDAGEKYKHTFSDFQHEQLAAVMRGFKNARVVMRFYDHYMIRSLYQDDYWTWRHLVGRKASNEESPEVLLTNFVA